MIIKQSSVNYLEYINGSEEQNEPESLVSKLDHSPSLYVEELLSSWTRTTRYKVRTETASQCSLGILLITYQS